MKNVCCLLVLVLCSLPCPSIALDLDEARRLAREPSVETIEAAFASHQAAFNAGEILPKEFERAYDAFITTGPRVLSLVDQWRSAMPESPQAMAAKAATLVHLAVVLRGNQARRLMPVNSLVKVYELYAEAHPLLIEALDLEPRQVYAASLLINMISYLGDEEAEARARIALRDYGNPEDLFFFDFNRLLSQSGGDAEQMHEFCRQNAPGIATITEDECDAVVTLRLLGVTVPEIKAALETLGAAGDDRFITLRAKTLVFLRRPREALDLYERNDRWIGWSDGWTLARALGESSALQRFSERWLAVNPHHPRHLAHLALALDSQGDFPGALKNADEAMRYGETIPEVRTTRMWVISRDEDRKCGSLEEFEDAIADTNAHPDVTEMITAALVRPAEYMTHRRDGSPIPDFECRRLRIYLQHANSCARTGSTVRNCRPDAMQQIFGPALEEERRAGRCRDMQTKTWRQLVEEWLQ